MPTKQVQNMVYCMYYFAVNNNKCSQRKTWKVLRIVCNIAFFTRAKYGILYAILHSLHVQNMVYCMQYCTLYTCKIWYIVCNIALP